MSSIAVAIPADSLLQNALERTDYQDAYAIDVPFQSPAMLVQMPLLLFQVLPAWFRVLIYLREAIATFLGLKTAVGMDIEQQRQTFNGQVGEALALFKVMGRSETELMMGENDRHLDFRLSFFAHPKEGHTQLILATTVQFNAWIGKLYFLPVGPIHRLITPIILRRIAAALTQEAAKGDFEKIGE
ncbi:MAG: DUF2867 domain-containing protein [Bacteroidota bacterium]